MRLVLGIVLQNGVEGKGGQLLHGRGPLQRGLVEKRVGLNVAGVIRENLLQQDKQPGKIPLFLQAGGLHQGEGRPSPQSGKESLFGGLGLVDGGPTGKFPPVQEIGVGLKQPLRELDDVGVVLLLHGAHRLEPCLLLLGREIFLSFQGGTLPIIREGVLQPPFISFKLPYGIREGFTRRETSRVPPAAMR